MTIVESFRNELRGLIDYLDIEGQISFRQIAESNLQKSLILSSASYFEARLSEIVLEYASEAAGDNPLITGVIQSKVIKRQYHTWSDWDNGKLGAFQSMFGEKFKKYITEQMQLDDELKKCATAFLELGRDRNRLVHQNYASFTVEKTSEEVFDLYLKADQFVESISSKLRECHPAS